MPYKKHAGAFEIQFRPNAPRQKVALKLKNYKGSGQNKVVIFQDNPFDDFLDCKDAGVYTKKVPSKEDKRCYTKVDPGSENFCEKIATGRYSIGGVTASNPVVLKFKKEGSSKVDKVMQFDLVGGGPATITMKTCNPRDFDSMQDRV